MSTRATIVAVLVAAALGGCAATGPRLGTQWTDPQFAGGRALAGAAVLVFCDAPDTALRLRCETDAASQLLTLGVRPLTDAALTSPTPGREPPIGAFLVPARAVGARAVFTATLAPDFSQVSSAPTFSIGVGGFGGSGGYRGGSGVGGGIGVTLPQGSVAPMSSGVAAIGSLVDVDSGRLVWTARATAPPGPDPAAQAGEALRVLAGALAQAGVL